MWSFCWLANLDSDIHSAGSPREHPKLPQHQRLDFIKLQLMCRVKNSQGWKSSPIFPRVGVLHIELDLQHNWPAACGQSFLIPFGLSLSLHPLDASFCISSGWTQAEGTSYWPPIPIIISLPVASTMSGFSQKPEKWENHPFYLFPAAFWKCIKRLSLLNYLWSMHWVKQVGGHKGSPDSRNQSTYIGSGNQEAQQGQKPRIAGSVPCSLPQWKELWSRFHILGLWALYHVTTTLKGAVSVRKHCYFIGYIVNQLLPKEQQPHKLTG